MDKNKNKPKTAEVDLELNALKVIMNILQPLDIDAQKRVIKYVKNKYGLPRD